MHNPLPQIGAPFIGIVISLVVLVYVPHAASGLAKFINREETSSKNTLITTAIKEGVAYYQAHETDLQAKAISLANSVYLHVLIVYPDFPKEEFDLALATFMVDLSKDL